MHTSVLFFKVSDHINHPLRNYRRYPNITVVKDLVFDESIGSDGKMDAYFDKSMAGKDGKYPVFINVHGGGFVRGEKHFRSGVANRIASMGYFVLNINYRLAPKFIFPAATVDTLHAIDSLEELSKAYPIDLNKIVVSGDSSGAFYAAHAVIAMYNKDLREELDLPEMQHVKKVRALLTFCAPFNLLTCLENTVPFHVTEDVGNCLFGDIFTPEDMTNFKYLKQSNCLNYINSDMPEFFIVAADKDSFCGRQLEDVIAKLDEFGVPYGYYRANQKGDGHCTHLLPWKGGTDACYSAVKVFLDKIREE